MRDKDKNFGGSLECDDVTWRQSIGLEKCDMCMCIRENGWLSMRKNKANLWRSTFKFDNFYLNP